MKQQWPYFLVVLSVFILLISPKQFADGMFLDGMIYATIARNMSLGLGYIWTPYYTAMITEFYEHPPLALWLESLFFRLLGDSIFVERIYSFLTFILTGGIILLIWKQVTGRFLYGWLPLLIWITLPLVIWASPNNMLENTMMIFTSLSVYFMLKSDENIYYIIISGICIALAFFSKGVFSLYVLSMPFWLWAWRSETRFARMLVYGLLLVVSALIPVFLTVLFDDGILHNIAMYWNQQVVKSVQQVQTVDNRFSILGRLISELLPAVIVTAIVTGIALRKRLIQSSSYSGYRSWILIFLCIGLSGVLPILVSLKQSGFYILTTFPFFSMGIALVALPVVKILMEKLKQSQIRTLKFLSVILFAVSIAAMVSQIGKIGRDQDEMNDMYAILEIVPRNTIIGMSNDLERTWELYARYSRYGNVALDPNPSNRYDYFMVEKNNNSLPGYHKVDIETSRYDLYLRDSILPGK